MLPYTDKKLIPGPGGSHSSSLKWGGGKHVQQAIKLFAGHRKKLRSKDNRKRKWGNKQGGGRLLFTTCIKTLQNHRGAEKKLRSSHTAVV